MIRLKIHKYIFVVIGALGLAGGFIMPNQTVSAATYSAKWVNQLEGLSVKQGDSVELWVDIKNTGSTTWLNSGDNAVKIATIRPQDRQSKLHHSSWLNENRLGVATQATVAPGEVGHFVFQVTAGAGAGKYREYFGLVTEGVGWFDKFYFYVEINILPAVYKTSWVAQSASPAVTPGEETTLWVELRNDGNTPWQVSGDNAVKLGTARALDRISAFAMPGWLSPNRTVVADKVVNPGEIGRFTFTIKAPDKVGTYKEYFRLVVERITWMNDLGIYWEITVNEELVLKNPIQVGLSSTTSDMTISSDAGMVIRKGESKDLVVRVNANTDAKVTARSGGYIVNVNGTTYDVSDWLRFVPLKNSIISIANEKVSSQYNRFRGLVNIRRSSLSGNVWMVNELELEDYMRGLAEVPDSWPIEARKAQIIAGRTFAFKKMKSPRADIFNIYDDTRDQVYYGYTYEMNRPGIAEAVMATTGMVIKYNGEPISAYYFSDSGGTTENVENAWNNGNTNLAIPYLKGVNDPYAKPITWEAPLTQAYMREIFDSPLSKIGAVSETVTDLIIDEKYPSGRLKTITIVTSTGKRTSLNTVTFEGLVDSGYVKSTNFAIEKTGEANAPTIILRGLGWGHGVGMPQWSAYNMASQGQTYQQILQYFYTGVNVGTI